MPGAPEIGGIILAGGASRRMGRNKSLLPYNGVPLIQHIADQLHPFCTGTLISTNNPDCYAFLGLPTVADRRTGQGPLMGVASSLDAAPLDWNLVVATDIPQLPLHLLSPMLALTHRHRCVVPRTDDGRLQPLFALYHRALAADMWRLLERGERRMGALLDHCDPGVVLASAEVLRNINTLEAYESEMSDTGRGRNSRGKNEI